MYTEAILSLSIVTLAIFSLLWFIVGIVVGRELTGKPAPRREARQRRRKRKSSHVEIYVGNLSYDVREKDLRKAFGEYGTVSGVRIIKNNFNGKSKGYGFVDMYDRKEAEDAIRALNGEDLIGRRIVVNEAKSQPKD